MNQVFISGRIAEAPVLRMENGEVPHLTFTLRVGHRTRAGAQRTEDYRVNAWNRIAQWGVENLSRGRTVALCGYLTQNAANANATEITAAEFLPSGNLRAGAATETSAAVEGAAADGAGAAAS